MKVVSYAHMTLFENIFIFYLLYTIYIFVIYTRYLKIVNFELTIISNYRIFKIIWN